MLLLLAAALPSLLTGPAPEGCASVPVPKVNNRPNIARATTSPWVESNGARYIRKPNELYCVEAPGRSAALAAAEAFAFGVTAKIHSVDGGSEFGRMLNFLKSLPPASGTAPLANIGVVDDGGPATGELMNLLSRRNLMYRIVAVPDPKLDVNVTGAHAPDPSAEAYEVRQKLGDQKRLLRLYGSEVVVGRLTGDPAHIRVHLLNYANRPVNGLRVRVLGKFTGTTASGAKLVDIAQAPDATEFTVETMNEYAVIDLK